MLSIVFFFRWQRSWGIAHRCSQLHSLGRLVQQRPEVLKNVKGMFPLLVSYILMYSIHSEVNLSLLWQGNSVGFHKCF